MKELEILLENFWIIKEKDPELYHMVKDATPKFKDFVEEKLGYKIIVNAYMIKLEKLPGKAESWMGIQQFTSAMEYAFFCILLMFLEDRGANDQFVLSQITEYIQAVYPGEVKVDWTLFSHRKSLVKVLKFATEIGLINVDDGNEQKFMESVETEVLYESTGLSRYFVRNFTGNILN
ncbi:MAG TPA: TIGR02678 family protein, partial [Clostridiaceae bacterium]|nr:TIGR02678 family protein [Clostridiaceae bacterium]